MEHIKHVMHGESKTRLYRIWSNLKNRVLPNSVKAKYYFDRGIGLCDEWKNSFISFRDWSINNGYDDKLTLDRIDNDGSYTPENCRWVDMKVQSNNRSNNISVRIEEGCIPFSEICRVLCIDYMYAYNKVVKHLSQEIDVERTGKNRKEPVSEELEKVVEEIVDSTVLNAYGVKEIANRLRNTICDTSISEDLGEYINELSKQFPEVSFAKLSRIAVRVAKWQKQKDDREIKMVRELLADFDKHCDEYHEAGFKHGQEALIKDAVDVEVKVDAGGYPYIPQMELYDYDKDVPFAKKGDRYKVILIKEG